MPTAVDEVRRTNADSLSVRLAFGPKVRHDTAKASQESSLLTLASFPNHSTSYGSFLPQHPYPQCSLRPLW